jgi:hypothetical protein
VLISRVAFSASHVLFLSNRYEITQMPEVHATLDEIIANWRAVLDEEEVEAGEIVVPGRAFPRTKQLRFYAALLAETSVPLEAVVIARELLVVAFDDRRPASEGPGFRGEALGHS